MRRLRSLCLEMLEWKRKSESNSHSLASCHPHRPEQQSDRKALDLKGNRLCTQQYGEKSLIHKNTRIKLWTSRNFLSGSSALPIGYFLLNFFAHLPTASNFTAVGARIALDLAGAAAGARSNGFEPFERLGAVGSRRQLSQGIARTSDPPHAQRVPKSRPWPAATRLTSRSLSHGGKHPRLV